MRLVLMLIPFPPMVALLRPSPARHDVQQNSEYDDKALDHVLGGRRVAQRFHNLEMIEQVETVADEADQDDSEQRPDDRAAAARQARAADHHGGDRVKFIAN